MRSFTRGLTLLAAGSAAAITLAAGIATAAPDSTPAHAATTSDVLANGAPDIDVSSVTPHLQRLQSIANANNGTRAVGTSGYSDSVDYVKQQAAAAGYQVSTQRFNSRSGASTNVLAELPGTNPNKVLMIGAHLDSVPAGPGINDDGSGSAALLAVADAFAQARPHPDITVRFAWWGAEELGMVGSAAYVNSLSGAEVNQIVGYLNFDMIGSPNPGYFVYKNDLTLRNTLLGYFDSINLPTEWDTEGIGRSDHASFQRRGVPVGGLFSGADYIKTQQEARDWGGTAGRAFDPCYHRACDTINNIDDTALDRGSDAISYSVWALTGDGATPTVSPTSGPTTTPPTSPPPGDCPPAWSASTGYQPGDQVSYNGSIYQATWWSTGAEPDAAGSWSVWKKTGSC